MKFRKAITEDLETLTELVDSAVAAMKADGIDQWQKGYPNKEILTEDIRRGSMYVLETEEELVGMLNLQQEPEPSYRRIDGTWLNDLPYASFHRVCVASSQRGKGYAGILFREAEALSLSLGFSSFRIDTHPDNRAMQQALSKGGYVPCGTIHLVGGAENGDPRLAYQKQLVPAIG